MDDFFGFISLILVLVPIVLIAMLAMLLARQKRDRGEISLTLQKIEDAQRGDRKLLRELSQRLIAPLTETTEASVFAPQAPATEQILFEIPAAEAAVVNAAQATEASLIISSPLILASETTSRA